MTDTITISCKNIKDIYENIPSDTRKITDNIITSGCKDSKTLCSNILNIISLVPDGKKIIDSLTVTETSILSDVLCPLFFTDCCTEGGISSNGSIIIDCDTINRIVYTFLGPQKNRDLISYLISNQSKEIQDGITSLITLDEIKKLPGELLIHKICSKLPFAYQEDMKLSISNIIDKNENALGKYKDIVKANTFAIVNCICPLPKKPLPPSETPVVPVVDTLKRKLYIGISIGIGILLTIVLKLFRVNTGLSIFFGILFIIIGVSIVWFDPFCLTKIGCDGKTTPKDNWKDISGNYNGVITTYGSIINISVDMNNDKGIINTLKCTGTSCLKSDFLSGITDKSFYIDSSKNQSDMGYVLQGPVIDKLKTLISSDGKPSIHNLWVVRKGDSISIRVYIHICPAIIGCIDPIMDIPVTKTPPVVSSMFRY